ncbi:MAG: glycosyltransferase family 2 protein [Bryobacteraceae bacterium]|nr:glycosyltransferase family 2 protein [Bryobacteraceae bacterium]
MMKQAMEQALSVVIPAYSEEGAIARVVAEVRGMLDSHGIRGEIVVVDDGSKDRTAQAAFSAGARVIRHRSNRGYGAALKTGISAARHDVVAIIDADGTYPASAIPAMLAELKNADMVVGARIGKNVKIPLVRRPAKWALKHLANYVTASSIPDLNSGLRVFRRNVVLQYFPILPEQFSWTTTITLAMHCDKYAVRYYPVDYRPRVGRSKIVPWDAMSFAVLILRTAMLFRPLRVFLPLVAICGLYGVAKTALDLYRDGFVSPSASVALMSALLILMIGTLGDAIATRLGHLNTGLVVGVQTHEEEMTEEVER